MPALWQAVVENPALMCTLALPHADLVRRVANHPDYSIVCYKVPVYVAVLFHRADLSCVENRLQRKQAS
jgi:hypothetical protein